MQKLQRNHAAFNTRKGALPHITGEAEKSIQHLKQHLENKKQLKIFNSNVKSTFTFWISNLEACHQHTQLTAGFQPGYLLVQYHQELTNQEFKETHIRSEKTELDRSHTQKKQEISCKASRL